MAINSPYTLKVGSVSYDLTKVVTWHADAANPSITHVRFQGQQSEIVVPLSTSAFELAYQNGVSVTLLDDVTVLGAGGVYALMGARRTYQAVLSGSGALSAAVEIQVSHDAVNWIVQATITLSGTDFDTDGAALDANWPYVRAELTELSGVGATIRTTVNILR